MEDARANRLLESLDWQEKALDRESLLIGHFGATRNFPKSSFMGDYRKLIAYQKAFSLAMEIFELTKEFPKEERFSLTDQFRRASRSVCVNFVEAYKRRRYRDYFISKMNDAETENAETQVWLDFSLACKYISEQKHKDLTAKNDEVAKLILYMINNPEKFC